MKKLMTIALTLMLSLSISESMAQEEMKYLFGGGDKKVSVSGFGAVINEFSAVDGDFAFLMGGGGAVLINQRYFFGGYGMGLTTGLQKNYHRYDYNLERNVYSPDLHTRFGHGGFWLGYIHNPYKAIHWGANMKIGWGAVTLSDLRYSSSDYQWNSYASDNVFVVTPHVDMGVNLLKWMRINVGVGYRLVTGVDKTYYQMGDDGNLHEMEYFDSNAFSNFEGSITLAFGGFSN